MIVRISARYVYSAILLQVPESTFITRFVIPSYIFIQFPKRTDAKRMYVIQSYFLLVHVLSDQLTMVTNSSTRSQESYLRITQL